MDTFLKFKKEKTRLTTITAKILTNARKQSTIIEICVLLIVERKLAGHHSDEPGKLNKLRMVYSKRK